MKDDRVTGGQDFSGGTGEEGHFFDRIGAQRRKTAFGSPEGERNESICRRDRMGRDSFWDLKFSSFPT